MLMVVMIPSFNIVIPQCTKANLMLMVVIIPSFNIVIPQCTKANLMLIVPVLTAVSHFIKLYKRLR